MKVMFIVNDLGVNEPFGPMILSAILQREGHETTLGVIKKDQLREKIKSWKPDVLAYSMMSVDIQDMYTFVESIKDIKKENKIVSILGGPHSTLKTDCVEHPEIDAICIGEGDQAIIDFVKCIQKGGVVDVIPNIMTSKNSKLELNNFVSELDELPFLDRELVYSYPEMARFGIKGIWASRGCVYPCPYCFNNRYNHLYRGKGKIIRRRSVDSIIEETKQLISKYRVEFVRIQDDVFVHRVDDWLKEFSKRWKNEIKKPFYCLLRSELITDEMAYYLKEAGCFSICMSIESADDQIRKKMMRRNISKEKLEKAFKTLKKHGINVYANTMLALPFSSLEQDIANIDFAIKVQPEMPNFSIFMPYPGTDLGDYSKSVGIFKSEDSDLHFGMRNMSPLTCFSDEVKRAQYNLCQLAIIAVKFPFFRNLIVNKLIYWKPNKIFFIIHYLSAMFAYGKNIFYFKHSPIEYVELIARTLKHYLYDFTGSSKKDKKEVELEKPKEDSIILSDKVRMQEFTKCLTEMSNGSIYRKSSNPEGRI